MVVGIVTSINILNSLKCMVTGPDCFFNRSCPFQKTKKFWTWEVLIFLLFLLKCDWIFPPMRVCISYVISFCEANSTWRGDISCKNLLNRPIFIEFNKTALSRVLHFTFFLLVTMKLIHCKCMTKASENNFFAFLNELRKWVGHYLTAAKVLKKFESGKILDVNVLQCRIAPPFDSSSLLVSYQNIFSLYCLSVP